MNKININTLKDLIFTLSEPVTTNITLQETVYKQSPLEDQLLVDILADKSRNSHIHDLANEHTDYAESNGLQLDSVQLSIFPSTLYTIMKNCVQFISPTENNDINSIKVFVCMISINNPQPSDLEYRMTLYYLATLSLDLTKQVIINNVVYTELLSFSKYINLNIIKTFSYSKINVPFPLITNDNIILSLTKQSRLKDDLRSILSYAPNYCDNVCYDTLQLNLINQQLKHYIYLILKPLLSISYIRIKNYGKNFISKSGELYINLFFGVEASDKPLIIETINQLVNFGILITNSNQLGFSFNDPLFSELNEISSYEFHGYSKELMLDRTTNHDLLGSNSFNYILFRLLGNDFNENLEKIDDLVINGNEQEVLSEILGIV